MRLLFAVLLSVWCAGLALAQGASFRVRGELREQGEPANGAYDFELRLFGSAEAAAPDVPIGATVAASAVLVSDGRFDIECDFGKAARTPNLYLDVRTRRAGGGAFEPHLPRRSLAEVLAASAKIPGVEPVVLDSNPGGEPMPIGADWTNVPLTYPEPGSPRRADFDTIWTKARTQTVRVCVLGDSQETLGANGDIYIHQLQACFGVAYGNVPETGFTGPGSAGGGQPAAQYVELSDAGGSPHGMSPSLFPPALNPSRRNGTTYGSLFLLQQDQQHSRRMAALVNSSFFDVSGRIDVQVLAMRRVEPSGQLRLFVSPQDSPGASYFSPVAEERVTADAALAAGGLIEPRLFTFAALPLNGRKYEQVYVRSTDTTRDVVIAGARYVNVSRPWGVSVTSFSAGGYTAARFLQDNANCGAVLGALNFDVYMIAYGINDAFSAGRTAAQFKSDVQQVINLVRAASPDARIILRVEAGWADHVSPDYDRYAVVEKELADANSRVLVLNHRKAMTLTGHTDVNESAAGLVSRNDWTPNTAYSVNDYVAQSSNAAYPRYWRCIQAHTSGASYSVNGPGTLTGHPYWVPWRWYGISATDAGHFSDFGQMRQAWVDALLLLSAGPGPAANSARLGPP